MTIRRAVAFFVLLLLAACTKAPRDDTPTIQSCASDIRVIPGRVDPGAGHRFLEIEFRNEGRSRCRMVGYPKVDLVDPQGKVGKHVPRTLRGQAGLPDGVKRPRPVILDPGGSAFAIVEASAFPKKDAPDCITYSLLITPPGMHHAVQARKTQLPDCNVQVHPVTARDGGTKSPG